MLLSLALVSVWTRWLFRDGSLFSVLFVSFSLSALSAKFLVWCIARAVHLTVSQVSCWCNGSGTGDVVEKFV